MSVLTHRQLATANRPDVMLTHRQLATANRPDVSAPKLGSHCFDILKLVLLKGTEITTVKLRIKKSGAEFRVVYINLRAL
jgi:hypothetical protein